MMGPPASRLPSDRSMSAKDFLIFVCALAAAASAQGTAGKVHPYLQQQLDSARPADRVPVYFVLRERLSADRWYPQIRRLGLAQRRALVLSDLRSHAEEAQSGLIQLLSLAERSGSAERLFSNWVGNFVQARATAAVILAAAARDEVGEVWYDGAPPRHQVEDGTVLHETEGVALPAPAVGPGPTVVNADKVWNLGFDGDGVLIMNADSGINIRQGDLANRVWVNPGEIPGDGLDNDGNMLIDDVHGWNYESHSGVLDDNGGHGTLVAGCMVGDGSCSGTTYGVAPGAKLMSNLLDKESSQWNAVQYALDKGADVFNSSHSYKLWFNPPPNYKMHRIVGEMSLAAGLVRTNSTSNEGGECDTGSPSSRPANIAAPGNLPPPYLDPNQTLRGGLGGVLGVGSWDWRKDQLAALSPCGPFAWNLADILARRPDFIQGFWDPMSHNDYPWTGGTQQGLLKPDISGPGDITTTAGQGMVCDSGILGGTSAATPVVAGCIALWKQANPSLTPEDVGMIIHQTAWDRGAVPGKENGWGAGIVEALAGLKRALAVHRVNGESAWEVEHRVGFQIDLRMDGVPSAMAAIAVGFERRTVNFGPVNVGIGSTVFTAWLGRLGTSGEGGVILPVSSAALGLTIYTQGFVDDLGGATGEILASNVVGVSITP